MRNLLTCLIPLTAFSLTVAQAQTSAKPPVSTPPPHAENQSPAFPGQTRAPEANAVHSPAIEVVANDFEHPWAITFMPDGNILLTEKPGRLRIVSPDGKTGKPIRGVPKVDTRDQGGLLDVTLAPDFEQSRTLYLSYAQPRKDNKTATAVASAKLAKNGKKLSDLKVIFQQEPAWESTKHYGSRLIWSDDNTLFVTLGERSLPEPRKLAQDIDTHIGKVVRIRTDGSPAPGNPWLDKDEGLPENWSYGHRNIQGAARHPETGELWVIEHGPQGGDEINVAEAGKNYGWPVITYGEDYSGQAIGEGNTRQDGMEQPLYYWDPVVAPAGSLFYEGTVFPEWRGNLLISSLTPGGLVRLELDGRKVTGEERLVEELGRVRDIAEGPDGALWLITDEKDGKLVRLTLDAEPAGKD